MNIFIENIKSQLEEAAYSDLKKAQKDVTKLFPSFYDRVDTVRLKGGIRMVSMKKDVWEFQIHSGTKENVWYTVVMNFSGIPEVIRHASKEPRVWKKGGSGVNLSKLAHTVFFNVDIKIKCDCKADLMWGPAYIRSQKPLDAYPSPGEDRFPIVRNPKLYSAHCKHIQLLMNLLPMYHGTFSKYLKKYYLSDITSAERFGKKEETEKEEMRKEETPNQEESVPEGDTE